jgi:hypothetical protein
MVDWSCCDNPSVTYVREAQTPDGGKQEYHKCSICGADHILTKDQDGKVLNHEVMT